MASQPIYQFYAELDDYEPKMWRRFQVLSNITMARLGYIIMTMFEMQASHLFCVDVNISENLYRHIKSQFSDEMIHNVIPFKEQNETIRFEVQNELTEDFKDEAVMNAAIEKLSRVISYQGDELTLSYDYGDGWEVKIVLECIIEDKELPGNELPRVLEGGGYGIIEDCGGPGGLEDIAKAFKKKKGSQFKEYCQWLGVEDLDLYTFDLDDMNFRLKKVPRIYADAYEHGLEPTKQSLALLMRKYKKL